MTGGDQPSRPLAEPPGRPAVSIDGDGSGLRGHRDGGRGRYPAPGPDPGARRRRPLREKPPLPLAERLRQRGALWNSFVIAGRPQTLERLTPVDLSREVLETRAERLAVLPVTGVGWDDLGEPARVLATRRRRAPALASA